MLMKKITDKKKTEDMEERVDAGCPNLLIGGARLSSTQNLPGHCRSIRLPILLLFKLLLYS